jgi:hypothetical protein
MIGHHHKAYYYLVYEDKECPIFERILNSINESDEKREIILYELNTLDLKINLKEKTVSISIFVDDPEISESEIRLSDFIEFCEEQISKRVRR